MAKKQKKHTQAVKTTHPKNKHENQPAQASQSKSVRPVKKERGWLLTSHFRFHHPAWHFCRHPDFLLHPQ